MNKERIIQLAEAIEQGTLLAGPERLGFNMNYFSTPMSWFNQDFARRDCGTVACIAGHAAAISSGSVTSFSEAAEWLGLPYDETAVELFFPGDSSGINVPSWSKITPAHAGAVLRRLAETGRVDWTAVLPEDMWTQPSEDWE